MRKSKRKAETKEVTVTDTDSAFMLSRRRDFCCIKSALEDAIEIIEDRIYDDDGGIECVSDFALQIIAYCFEDVGLIDNAEMTGLFDPRERVEAGMTESGHA